MRLRSMRARMTAAFVGLILGIAALSFTAIEHATSRMGATSLESVTNEVTEALAYPNWQARLNARFLTPTTLSPSRLAPPFVQVGDDKGHVLWRSDNRISVQDLDASWRVETSRVNSFRIAAARKWRGAMDEQSHVAKALAIFLELLLPVVAVGSWVLVGKTLRPIRDLSRQADSASAVQLSGRLTPPSEDREIVDLVNTLNGLLERISATVESKGRFYSAASHELRTPLQALSGHLETAISRERSPDEYRTALVEAQAQTLRLSVLVRDLLFLHQVDSSTTLSSDTANLMSSLETTLRDSRPLIDVRGLEVNLDVPVDFEVKGNQTHLDVVVRNLVENAVRYASSSSKIEVKADPIQRKLTVLNAYEFEPSFDVDKLFEPFYRPDATRNAKTGGNGLGLAICRAAAKANAWTLTLQRVPTGILATVEF